MHCYTEHASVAMQQMATDYRSHVGCLLALDSQDALFHTCTLFALCIIHSLDPS